MRSLAPLLALVGCGPPGEVQLTGLEPFGDVSSAVWIVASSETSTEHRLLLSTAAGACPALQDASRLLGELEVGPRDDCAGFQEAMREVAATLDDLVGAGAASVELTLSGAPSEGAWSTADPDGEDLGPIFAGHLRQWHENPYAWAASEYVCDDPDPLSEYVSELVDDSPLRPATLTLDRVSARALEGSLEGSVGADDDGDINEIGAITAEATWSRCALDAADDPVLDAF